MENSDQLQTSEQVESKGKLKVVDYISFIILAAAVIFLIKAWLAGRGLDYEQLYQNDFDSIAAAAILAFVNIFVSIFAKLRAILIIVSILLFLLGSGLLVMFGLAGMGS